MSRIRNLNREQSRQFPLTVALTAYLSSAADSSINSHATTLVNITRGFRFCNVLCSTRSNLPKHILLLSEITVTFISTMERMCKKLCKLHYK